MNIGLRPARILEHGLQTRTAGHALLVHARGEVDPRSLAFATGLAPDTKHALVVVDLPAGSLEQHRGALARALPGRAEGVRLVFTRQVTAREVLATSRSLADAIGRIVLAPAGETVRTADGGLFVPSDSGTGWTTFRPGREPQHDSLRFPKPSWEFTTFSTPWKASEHTTVEPLPSGVWVRTASGKEVRGRRWLMEELPCHPDVLTVVLGSPGGPPVPVADIARYWETVLPSVRGRVRFVHYGPLAKEGGRAHGQDLADVLGCQVVVYAGMPLAQTDDGAPAVMALHPHATRESRPYIGELVYFPRTPGAQETPPVLFGLRPPLMGAAEVQAGVFEYSSDAVLEVVQCGLWIRPLAEPVDADDVRCLPAGPGRNAVLYDRSTPSTADRMRALAEDVLWRLDPATRATFQVAPADDPWSALLTGEEEIWSVAVDAPAGGEAPAVDRPAAGEAAQRPGTAGASLPAADAAVDRSAPETVTGTLPGARRVQPAAAQRRPPVEPAAPAPAPLAHRGTLPPAVAAAPADPAGTGPAGHVATGGTTAESAGPAAPAPTDRATSTGDRPAQAADRAHPSPAVADHDLGAVRERGTGGPSPTASMEPAARATESPEADPAPRDTVDERATGAAPPADVDPPEHPVEQPAVHASERRPPAEQGGRVQGAGRLVPGSPLTRLESGVPGAHGSPEAEPPRARRPHQPPAASVPLTVARPSAPAEAKAAGVRVEPVPKASTSAAPGGKDITKEREWVRRTFSGRYHAESATVARIVSQAPGLRGKPDAMADDALTDLVAVRLFLSGDGAQVDQALRSATVGSHIPLARCVASGLLRLPSYRGPALLRTKASTAEVDWYAEGRLVTEWGFGAARTDVLQAPSGTADFLIWSMTARRTGMLDPARSDVVMFVPGSSFRVLRVDDAGRRPTVMLRELLPAEIGATDPAQVARVGLDEIALAGLEQAAELIEEAAASGAPPGAAGPGSGWPPGLLSARHRPPSARAEPSAHTNGAAS